MVNRTRPAAGYWDHPVRSLAPTDDLAFIDFFDFDEVGVQDFAYFRVAVRASKAHADLVGHEALIEVQRARVFVED